MSSIPNQPQAASSLLERLEDRSARVGVVGMGYVGLPLAVEFASAGLTTTGIDLNADKVELVSHGTSYLSDVTDEEVAAAVGFPVHPDQPGFTLRALLEKKVHVRGHAPSIGPETTMRTA